jgi:hypothetical protein
MLDEADIREHKRRVDSYVYGSRREHKRTMDSYMYSSSNLCLEIPLGDSVYCTLPRPEKVNRKLLLL